MVSFGNGLFCAPHPLVLEAVEAYASAQSSSPGHGAQNRVPGLGKPLSHPGSTHCIWALPLEIRPTSHKLASWMLDGGLEPQGVQPLT